MSRIDVKTLVLAFEKRIEALEKNPPDKVPTAVVINLLERAIDEVIKEHFIHLIKAEIEESIRFEFEKLHDRFVKKTIKELLTDEQYRAEIQRKLKFTMIESVRKMNRE